MPNSVTIKQCLRKEPTTREDYLLLRMKKMGILPCKERKMIDLPKAPGVFSLGPDRIPMQVPNNEVEQPVVDVTNLESVKEAMRNLF